MIQAIGKQNSHKNAIMYGVLSDGVEFVFLRLDNDHQVLTTPILLRT